MNDETDMILLAEPVKQFRTIAEIRGDIMEALKAYIAHVHAIHGNAHLQERYKPLFNPTEWGYLQDALHEVHGLKRNTDT